MTARRVVAALVLAVAVLVGAGQSASADCLYPPVVQNPLETDSGQIDPGPEVPTGSPYSQFGYGGLDVVRYESGSCVAGVSVTGRPNTGVSGMVYGAGKWVATAVTAVAVALAREVFTDGPLWQAVAAMFAPLQAVIPPQSFALLATMMGTLAFTMVVLVARRGDKTGWAFRRYAAILAISFAAIGCYTWNAVIPDMWGKTAGISLAATQDITTGSAGAADVAIGDMFTDHVLMPMWARAQLGSDQAAIDTYAWRLRAASTLTRSEVEQVRSGQARFEDIKKAKEGDYRKTAAELKGTHPQAYAHLTGEDTTGRGWSGVMGAGVAAAAAAMLVAALAVVAAGKAAGVAAVHGFPVVAPFLMLPRLHGVAGWLAVALWDAFLATVGAVFVFVLWMLGPMRGLSVSEVPILWRLVGLGLIYGLLWAGWKWRRWLASKVPAHGRIEDVRERVDSVVKDVAAARDASTTGDGSTGKEVSGSDAGAVTAEPDAVEYAEFEDDDQSRAGFRERVVSSMRRHRRPTQPPPDDPDVPLTEDIIDAEVVDDVQDERVEVERFQGRVAARLDRFEEDEFERRRIGRGADSGAVVVSAPDEEVSEYEASTVAQ